MWNKPQQEFPMASGSGPSHIHKPDWGCTWAMSRLLCRNQTIVFAVESQTSRTFGRKFQRRLTTSAGYRERSDLLPPLSIVLGWALKTRWWWDGYQLTVCVRIPKIHSISSWESWLILLRYSAVGGNLTYVSNHSQRTFVTLMAPHVLGSSTESLWSISRL